MVIFYYFAYVLFILFILVKNEPTLRFAMNEGHLEDLYEIMINYLLVNTTIDIDPIDIIKHIDLIGTMELNISYPNITLTKIHNDSIKLDFYNIKNPINIPYYILLNLKEIELNISFLYAFDSNFYNSFSYCNVTISNISFGLNFTIYPIKNLYEPFKNGPSILINSFNIPNLPNFNFDFININNEEKRNFDIFLLKKFYPDIIESLLPYAVDLINQNLLNNINSYLKNQLYSLKLKNIISYLDYSFLLSYSMNEMPLVFDIEKTNKTSENIFEIGIELLIKNSKSNKQYERKDILKLPHVTDNDFGLTNAAVLIIGNDLLNNIFYIIYDLGLFSQYIHHNISSSFNLRAYLLLILINEIPQKYGYLTSMDINLTCLEIPKIKLYKDNIHMDFNYNIQLILNETALNTDVDFYFDTNIFIKEGKFNITINHIHFTRFNIIESKVENVTNSKLLDNFNTASDAVMNIVNPLMEYFLKNITLPKIYNITIQDVDFKIGDDYLKLGISPYI